jgi:hypothetical protein
MLVVVNSFLYTTPKWASESDSIIILRCSTESFSQITETAIKRLKVQLEISGPEGQLCKIRLY